MSHLEALAGLTFTTNRNAVIQSIGASNWNAFAMQSGAQELDADAVIGRNLFDFIAGAEVRNQYRRIMERVAADPNWVWVLPFRCDAPGRERHIRQSVKPIFSDHLCTGFIFQSVEQHSHQRPPIDLYDFKKLRNLAKEDQNLPVVTMCSWCQRVNYAPIVGDTWVSAEDYYAAGGRSKVQISHAICEDCLESTADGFLPDAEAHSRSRQAPRSAQ
ncbi:hypothetical protein SAMN05444414_1105 [Roseovarius marisflavi]|uniref:Uncharacterized protein n=1 Tax=Roseovarius marisflavi TaxID=1054996 RepID=A0A1M6ZG25_9RHOB|nr:hypothetical protein [Roseovarius marisflavi]SHL29418.1 hypothetical protein SAMN05444414_1105 [Roseovarius marisflavi]